MSPDEKSLQIPVKGLRVVKALQILDKVDDLLERLWTAGALHALLNLPEGRDAAATWEQLAAVLKGGLEKAASEGKDSIDLWLEIPADSARATVTFVAGLLQRGRASGELSEADLAFTQPYLDQASQAIAMAGL